MIPVKEGEKFKVPYLSRKNNINISHSHIVSERGSTKLSN